MSKTLKYIIGFCAISFLFIFVRNVDFNHVISEVVKIKWWMLLILLSTTAAYLLATKAWQLSFLSASVSIPKFEKLFVIRQLGETLTLINPTNIVGGELSKIYMLRSSGLKSSTVETSIVLSRGLIILSYFFLAIIVLLFYILKIQDVVSQAWIVLFVLIIVSLLAFVFYGLTSKRLLIHFFVKGFFSFLRISRFESIVPGVHKLNKQLYLFYTNQKKIAALVFLYSLGHWLAGSLEFYFILTALNIDVSLWDAITIEIGVMAFKSLGGFVPGQIGIEEYANKLMLEMIGVHDVDLWVVVSIIRRARQLFWIAVSLLFLGIYYKSYRWKSFS